MRKIKIAEIITRLDWGGSPDVIRLICTYLDPNLYDLTLVTGNTKHPSRKTSAFLENLKGKLVVIQQLKRDINPLKDFIACIKIYILLRRGEFDIVHTHTAKAGALARIACFFTQRPIVIHSPHGHNFYGYFGPVFSRFSVALERLLSRITDKIIVSTALEKDDFLKFKVAAAKKVCLIRQGLEWEDFLHASADRNKVREIFNIQPDEDVVGMVGRLEPVKGPGYFVEAARNVTAHSQKAKFMLIGEGSLRKKLEKRVEELGLREKFIFTGWRDDIPALLSALDALVLPSLNEAVGRILIEAQGMGVPIVATKVGGIPEVILDNQSGILVSAADPETLATAISDILSDTRRRLSMSQAGRDWVKDKFKAQDMAEDVSRLYQDLMAEKK